MKNKTILLQFTFWGFVVMCSCKQHKVTPSMCDKNPLEVLEPHYSFGEVSKSNKDTIQFSFVVENHSDKMISLDKIDVSCNCVKIDSKQKPLHPHSIVKINGYINLKNQLGHLSKAIFINYNNGNLLQLRVSGDVKE